MREPYKILLAALCISLVITWVYHLYDKYRYSQLPAAGIIPTDTVIADNYNKDSLIQEYQQSLSELDATKEYADSLHKKLGNRIQEMQELKQSINQILQKKQTTQEDLLSARKKIQELKVLYIGVQQSTQELESEKRQLQQTLDQLSTDMQKMTDRVTRLSNENVALAHTISLASTFILNDLDFKIVQTGRKKEQSTSIAAKAGKMIISFTVQNKYFHLPATPVYIAVKQPGDSVLQLPIFNSATFINRNNEKVTYTLRESFDYEKGEVKKIIHTITPGTFSKGNYQLIIYHNGVVIGRSSKTLE